MQKLLSTLTVSVLYLFITTSTQHRVQADQKASPARRNAAKQSDQVPEPTLSSVSYGDHERHVLDLWKATSDTPTPLVFVIHGGGWQAGNKERVGRFVNVQQLLNAGISVTAINYRFVSQAVAAGMKPPVKAPLYDAAKALQFVRSKADEWNLDATRIGAAGGSAGACSSLWLAFHDDLANPNSSDAVARQSTRLTCAAVMGAQTTLDPLQMRQWTPNSRYGAHAFGISAGEGQSAFQRFVQQRERIMPWIQEYSPYALVTADDPGVYLFYNAPPAPGQNQKDPTHTSNFGVKLQEHCNKLGVNCELVYPGAPDVQHRSTTDFLISRLKPASR